MDDIPLLDPLPPDQRRHLEEAARGPGRLPGAAPATFVGGAALPLLDGHATTIGTLRTLVLPLLEADQTLQPGDVERLHGYLAAELFPVLTGYWSEVSRGMLATTFDMLGAEFLLGATPGDLPLQLPRAFSEYFHGEPSPGGLQASIEGFAEPYQVLLEGGETLRLHVTHPEVTGPGGVDVDVAFAALALTRVFTADPVLVFGGEEVTLVVTPPTSAQTLVFPPRTISIATADPGPGLRALEEYLNGVLAAAGSGGPAGLRLRARARRIPTGAGFGELHLDLAFTAPPTATRLVAAWHGDVLALDFGSAVNGLFQFHSSGIFNDEASLRTAIARGLLHGEVAAGLDPAAARLFADPRAEFLSYSGSLQLEIGVEGFATGRAITLVAQTGLEALGFSGERPTGTRISTMVRVPAEYLVTLVGSETAALEITPGGGASPFTADLRIPAVAGVTGLPSRPEVVTLTGAELALGVTDDAGTNRDLRVTFPTASFLLRAAEFRADLAAIEASVDARLAEAERAAGVTERLLWVRLAEIPTRDGQRLAGFLGYRRHIAALRRRFTVSVIGDPDLGLFSIGLGTGVGYDNDLFLDEGRTALEDFLEPCVHLSGWEAGRSADDPLFARPEVTLDAENNRLKILLPLAGRIAGRGASARLLSQVGLERLGLDRARPVTGSVIGVDDQFTVRQFTRGSAVPGDEDAPVFGDEIITALFDRVPADQRVVLRERIHANYQAVMLLIVGPAPATGGWTTQEVSVDDAIREFAATAATLRHTGGHPEHQVTRTFFVGTLIGEPAITTMAHEMGHVLGFYDLYPQSTHRDDLEYLERWSIMGSHEGFPHVDGFHKQAAGWLDDDPEPTAVEGASETMILVAHERWDPGLADAARAAFGDATLQVRPLMRLLLGGDGAQTVLIEARQRGARFGLGVPESGRVLVTNTIHHADVTRYREVRGYRRHVHLLANLSDGGSSDLGSLDELAVGGTTVAVTGRRELSTPDGPVIAFLVEVTREPAEFVDLYFHGTTPPWHSSDLWIDHPAGERTVHPVGEPINQGDPVRVPRSGEEPHDVVARIWNSGGVEAREVTLRYYICRPAGAGDRGNFVEIDRRTASVVPSDGETPAGTLVVGTWLVPPDAEGHQCVRVDIADWSLPPPSPGAPPVRDDFTTSNNSAQQNLTVFEALASSPFAPIEFDYSVANDGPVRERARLQAEQLPAGMRLTVSPAGQTIPPGEVRLFHCRLQVNDKVVQLGAASDREFLIVARRDARVTEERWGAVRYIIRPRVRTSIPLEGGWSYGPLQVTGEVSPHPLGDRVRLRVQVDGRPVEWHVVPMRSGRFEWNASPPPPANPGGGARVTAYYEGDRTYGSSVSAELAVRYVTLI